MWAKNLLMLALCLGGLVAFQASVFPPEFPHDKPAAFDDPAERQDIVNRLNAAMRDNWQQAEVEPVEKAPNLAIARRLSLALMGVVPSLEEIRLFEQQPPQARLEWWMATILADRRSSDYMAERLARAYVGVEDGPFLLYRRRRFVAWVADQLQQNRPYDSLVRHLIADSGLWTSVPSTNFITVNIKPDSDEDPDPNRLAARVSRAFLGVRIDCAECHDHPFEDWKQQDFQQLAAFFAQTKRSLRGISDGPGVFEVEDRKSGQKLIIEPHVPFQADMLPDEGSLRRRLALWVTHPENKAFARATVNRAWGLMFGKPLLEPIDNIPTSAAVPAQLQLLADDFIEHNYDWRRLLRVIAASEVFQLDSQATTSSDSAGEAGQAIAAENAGATPAQQAQWAVFPLVRLRPEQVVGALLQSASLSTIDYQSHIVTRVLRNVGQNTFVQRYGDAGSDEFDDHGGTIPQRLLMMNGELVRDKTHENLVGNAATRIAVLAPDDRSAVETAYLAVLTRRPSDEESSHFAGRLAGSSGAERHSRMEDLYWTLLNTTEFSWNH